jgi:hypothetical protein
MKMSKMELGKNVENWKRHSHQIVESKSHHLGKNGENLFLALFAY